jgi:AraC family transcriptional regulator of adaptative response / DNA-3-methyladenine glycosylase II
MSRDDLFYRAMLARDNRFDGKFFVGVKTTGIYCRPVCPARPRRENVEFFAHARLAEQAGYRPCLRCRLEAAPGSPAWTGKTAVVQRALKAIADQETAGIGEEAFAGRFGVGARHLRRLFMAELGKSPKRLILEGRLDFARKLIAETRIPMAEVARTAGFTSLRRFNAAIKDRFRRPPTALRRPARGGGEGLALSLPFRPKLCAGRVCPSHSIHPSEAARTASRTHPTASRQVRAGPSGPGRVVMP